MTKTTYAEIAAFSINALALHKFGAVRMASTITSGVIIDAFDHTGYASHKYIPADRLTADLGEPEGSGVYGFWAMKDGSCLLVTCHGRLAFWDGSKDSPAQWGDVPAIG